MTGSFWHRISLLALIAGVIFVLSGCTPSIDGDYQDANGVMSVTIQSGKATIKSPVGNFETECKQDGDKVTLSYQGQPLVLTRQSDGSLVSDTLKLTKK
jgi:hypothetical protein